MKKIINFKLLCLFSGLLAGTAGLSVYATPISFHSPVVDAADEGDEQAILVLLKQGQPVDARGDFDITPLMRTAYRGDARMTTLFLRLGADTNARDIAGTTALHLACRQGNATIVKLLLDYGANPNARDVEGWTPLMRAALARQPDIVRMLLEKGADPSLENTFGEPVLLHAVQADDLESVETLVAQGAVTKDNVFLQPAITTATRKGNRAIALLLQGISQGGTKENAPAPDKSVSSETPITNGIVPLGDANVIRREEELIKEKPFGSHTNMTERPVPLGNDHVIRNEEELATGESLGIPVPDVKVTEPRPFSLKADVKPQATAPKFLETEDPASIVKVASLDALRALPMEPPATLQETPVTMPEPAVSPVAAPVTPIAVSTPLPQHRPVHYAVPVPKTTAPLQPVAYNTSLPAAASLDTDTLLAAGRQGTPEEQEVAAILLAQQQRPLLSPAPQPQPHMDAVPTPQPSAYIPPQPQKKARVEVAEAIPVRPGKTPVLPVIAKKEVPKQQRFLPETPQVNTPAPAVYRPVATIPQKGYWVQVGNFPTQKVAIDFVNVIRNNTLVRGKRLRVVKLAAEAIRQEPAIAIQMGLFASQKDAKGLCTSDLSYLQCKVVEDNSAQQQNP